RAAVIRCARLAFARSLRTSTSYFRSAFAATAACAGGVVAAGGANSRGPSQASPSATTAETRMATTTRTNWTLSDRGGPLLAQRASRSWPDGSALAPAHPEAADVRSEPDFR